MSVLTRTFSGINGGTAVPYVPSTDSVVVTRLGGSPTDGIVSGVAPIASPTFTGTVTIPNGAVLGTPLSGNLVNCTGFPAQSYPGAGIANSTGSAWGTSYTTIGTGTVIALAAGPTFTGTVTMAAITASGLGTFNSLNIGAVATDAMLFQNSQASTVGTTSQWPGQIHFSGTAYKSAATAASQVVDFTIGLQPQTGSSTTTGKLVFSSQVAGGGYVQNAILTNGGQLQLAKGTAALPAIAIGSSTAGSDVTSGIYNDGAHIIIGYGGLAVAYFALGGSVPFVFMNGASSYFSASSTTSCFSLGNDTCITRPSAGLLGIANFTGSAIGTTTYLNLGYGGSTGTALIGMPSIAGATGTLTIQGQTSTSGTNNGGNIAINGGLFSTSGVNGSVIVNTGFVIDGGGNIVQGNGKTLKLGNTAVTGLVAGALAALTTATITLTDQAGNVYRVPCVTP